MEPMTLRNGDMVIRVCHDVLKGSVGIVEDGHAVPAFDGTPQARVRWQSGEGVHYNNGEHGYMSAIRNLTKIPPGVSSSAARALVLLGG